MNFPAASELLARFKRPLLLSHAKPDGDAIGALIAMRCFLRAQGADPLVVIFDGIPYRYDFLERHEPLAVLGRSISIDGLTAVDGVVVVDTCAANQLEPLAAWLSASTLPKLVVDHHITRDFAADAYVIDESAAAACLILHDWTTAMNWPIDPLAAEALFVGIATDTGWFRHSNTDARALAAAADLAARGVRVHELSQRLYQSDSVARVRLLSSVLDTLELHCQNRLAVMHLAAATIAALGAKLSDTEDMVNEPLRVASVVVSILIVEQDANLVRVNLRSKAPLSSTDLDIDVAAIAKSFGGGGHRRAAGARLQTSLSKAVGRVTDQVMAAAFSA